MSKLNPVAGVCPLSSAPVKASSAAVPSVPASINIPASREKANAIATATPILTSCLTNSPCSGTPFLILSRVRIAYFNEREMKAWRRLREDGVLPPLFVYAQDPQLPEVGLVLAGGPIGLRGLSFVEDSISSSSSSSAGSASY